jgi:hypothetical protein
VCFLLPQKQILHVAAVYLNVSFSESSSRVQRVVTNVTFGRQDPQALLQLQVQSTETTCAAVASGTIQAKNVLPVSEWCSQQIQRNEFALSDPSGDFRYGSTNF